MAVSQWVRKFTWLLDEVEVKGIVRGSDGAGNEGEDIGDGDDFDIVPDPNYAHLVAYIPGAKNSFPTSSGVIHCETYPLTEPWTAHWVINRQQLWPLPKKPGEDGTPKLEFMVSDPMAGSRPLRIGDHVRVVGRWVIENGHPYNERMRGWLKIGDVFVEFHPFRWSDISLVTKAAPQDPVEERVSLAAPLYSSVYIGTKWMANYLAGVSSWPWDVPLQVRVFVKDDLSDFHNSVRAEARISAPDLVPSGIPCESGGEELTGQLPSGRLSRCLHWRRRFGRSSRSKCNSQGES